MNDQTNSNPPSHDAVVRAMIANPDTLADAYHETMVELMHDLAEGALSGEARELAEKLRANDAEADSLFQLMRELPTAERPAAQAASASALVDLVGGLNRALGGIYAAIAALRATDPEGNALAIGAQGDEPIREETILVHGVPCTLRLQRTPQGEFDAELVIPPGVKFAPGELDSLELKLVERPQPLVFVRRPSGNLVATYVLPATVADPTKQVVVSTITPA